MNRESKCQALHTWIDEDLCKWISQGPLKTLGLGVGQENTLRLQHKVQSLLEELTTTWDFCWVTGAIPFLPKQSCSGVCSICFFYC